MQQQMVAIIFVAAQPKVPWLILPLFAFKAIFMMPLCWCKY